MDKDNFSLTPDFTRVHDPYCNCFDCSTNSIDGVISQPGQPMADDFDLGDLKLYSEKALGYLIPIAGTANDAAITATLAAKKAMADAGKPLSDAQVDELAQANKTAANKIVSTSIKDNLFSITKWIVIGVLVILVINITLKKFL